MPGQIATERVVRAPNSPLQGILASLPRVAASRANVLVTGESGVGKEGIARLLHEMSPWQGGPMVPVNCGAIPENLLESELFGHVRGAFTGADRRRVGRFEAAAGGTLLLDEIGEMPLAMQVKLLRVLQEHEFEPVGASRRVKADFRLVAATNRDLREMVSEGQFREDLFFRLDVVRVHVPPLRERPMDVPLLARHFIERYAACCASEVDGVAPDALELMQRYPWPGNVRELENTIQGVLVLKGEGRIEAGDVAARLGGHAAVTAPRAFPPDMPVGAGAPMALPDDGLDLREAVEALERELIRQALQRSEGNKTAAAGLLNLNRTTLVEKIKRIDDLQL